jgi:agmatine deiminase
VDAAPHVISTTPAADGLRMPPEIAPHERTLMAWPCRRELWGDQLAAAEQEFAGVANAIAAFEPVTMVCGSPEDAARARAALAGAVEVLELPIDDSWMRDMGPIFVVGDDGRRAGVHFGFNAWGEKFSPWDRDAAVGALIVEHLGDPCYRAPFVLEGGSIAVDDRGTLLTTEQCLLHPNRNPDLDRAAIEEGLRAHLGVRTIVWFGDGLLEDRDTDGHVDVIADFAEDGALLLQSVPEDNPNHEACVRNHEIARAAGLDVVDFPLLAYVEVAGERAPLGYLNLYACNGGVIVPVGGDPQDEEALARVAAAYPSREVVGVEASVIAYGGGGPHCITQQVPAS